ncbi:MAG: HNH endonuclease [Mesorhizobium sp.]|nr:MAG: HNH endonuclease [Mesorhizobium sp.]
MSSKRGVWRSWYKSSRWRYLRERILLRDLYTCQRTGALLVGRYPAPNSPVVDHIKPHRGDEALFWEEANLMAVSKEWHDKTKQAEEQGSLQQRGIWH